MNEMNEMMNKCHSLNLYDSDSVRVTDRKRKEKKKETESGCFTGDTGDTATI